MKKIMLAILIFADQCSAEISTVKSCPENQTGCYLVTERNGITSSASEGSRLYRRAQDWVANGGQVQPADAWAASLAEAQSRVIKEIRRTARSILSSTDWYSIRKYENGTAVPAPITAYRASVRQASNDAITAVNACADIACVRAVQPAWPADLGE